MEEPAYTRPRRRSRGRVADALRVAALACVVAVGCSSIQRLDGERAAESATFARLSVPAPHPAVSAARERVLAAQPNGTERRMALFREAFVAAADARDVEAANRIRALWIPPIDDPRVVAASVQLARAAGDTDSARGLAWDGARRFPDERNGFVRLWYATLLDDPAFAPREVTTLRPGDGLDRIDHLGGGSSITFRFRLDGETVAAFKPAQTRRQSRYRSELAAYRLCALMRCHFDVPHNREVRISRDDFLALNGREDRDDVRRFDSRYADLEWFEDDDGEWLYGTEKAWIPEFRGFFIENRALWEPLVAIDEEPPDDLRALMSELYNTRGRGARDPGDLGTLTMDTLARQVSDLHVFDFLANNWDRYSSRYPGTNCQWHRDRFVSIDNGAAFPPRGYGRTAVIERVERRLERVQRFSRETINAIRWMDVHAAHDILFPPTDLHDEKPEFAAFVARRDLLLAYVDSLIAQHGEAAVLAFE